jgi:hypothetical protein
VLVKSKNRYNVSLLFFFNSNIVELLRDSGFQDPATSVMEGILNLHHDIMFFIVITFIFVG